MSRPEGPAAFSPSDAAFAVFELAKRHPGFTVRYCVATAIVMTILGYLGASSGLMGKLVEFQALSAGGRPVSQAQMERWMEGFDVGAALMFLVVFLIASTILTAAALRKTVRDEEKGFAGLQAGRDEFNLLIATLMVGGVFFAVIFVVSLVSGVLGAFAPSLAILGLVAMALAYVVLLGRLCQYGVMTIAEGRPGVKASWLATRETFWRFIGAHLLWFAVYSVLSLIVVSLLNLLLQTGAPATDAAAFLRPNVLIGELLRGAIQGFAALGWVSVGAYAWHQMRAGGA
jgi:hypothetical protein